MRPKYDLFERLNSLGSRLSDQELRIACVMIDLEFYKWLEAISAFKPFQDSISLTDRPSGTV